MRGGHFTHAIQALIGNIIHINPIAYIAPQYSAGLLLLGTGFIKATRLGKLWLRCPVGKDPLLIHTGAFYQANHRGWRLCIPHRDIIHHSLVVNNRPDSCNHHTKGNEAASQTQ